MPAKTICVVDDDKSVRESLRELLDAAGYEVADFGSAKRFLESDSLARCDCLVTDVRMPEMDGLALQEELIRRSARFPVIIITGHGDVPLAVRAMRAGAADFIEKPFKHETLLASIDRALQTAIIPQSDADRVVAQRTAELTDREREVLALLVLGDANKVIAQKLNISFRTVEIHRSRVLAKMQVSNIAELVRLVIAGEVAGEK